MKYLALIIYFIRFFNFSVCIDYDGWLSIKVEHSLGCTYERFCPRGTISLKSIRDGTAIIQQQPFTNKHIEELKQLADIDGFYNIRTVVTTAENKQSDFLSSVKAQAFLDNGLTDVINVWVLPTGGIIAVNFQVTNNSQPLTIEGNNGYHINSNFYLRYVEQAPVPDTTSYIQKLEREREAREKGELKDNRSFLAKYWMYIVPIAIFAMISGAANTEPAPASR